MTWTLKARLLMTALLVTTVSDLGAQRAFAQDWPPLDADPNGYYSSADHQGYYDHNGNYHSFQAAPTSNVTVAVSFDSFHDRLAHHGNWVYSDRWGEVWQPGDVSDNWRPYTQGHWVDTEDYGWLWVSDEPFGEITYHYGRWVNDPDEGWLWVPGYVWSPAWVVWRHSGEYTGWMPMPPDDRFLHGSDFEGGNNVSVGVSVGGINVTFNNWNNLDDQYGYARWYGHDYGQDRFNAMWTFVPLQHFADPDYRRYLAPRENVTTIIRTSTNVTNYTVVNNYIVNKSVSVEAVQRAGGAPVHLVRAADVIKQPNLIAPVDKGSRIQVQMRTQMPHGTGAANSAPKPTEAQVKTLSTKQAPVHPGATATGQPSHLLTRDAAAVIARPNGSKPIPLTAADTAKATAVVQKSGPTPVSGTGGSGVQTPTGISPERMKAPVGPAATTPGMQTPTGGINPERTKAHEAPGGPAATTPGMQTPTGGINPERTRAHEAPGGPAATEPGMQTPAGGINPERMKGPGAMTPNLPAPTGVSPERTRAHEQPGSPAATAPSVQSPAGVNPEPMRKPAGPAATAPSVQTPAGLNPERMRAHEAPSGPAAIAPKLQAPGQLHTEKPDGRTSEPSPAGTPAKSAPPAKEAKPKGKKENQQEPQ